MARQKITLTSVANLESGATIWDTDVAGFGARRQCQNTVYILKYRFHGRQRYFTIGRHGSPWTPATARSEARRLLGLTESNENPRDPSAERDAFGTQPTFAEFAKMYLEDYAPLHKKPRAVQEDARNLRLHILPVIGPLKMSEITRGHASKIQLDLRGFKVKGNRCLGTLSAMMTVAEKWGLRAHYTNPCRGVDRIKEHSRERFLTSEELARLGEALDHAERGYSDAEWEALPPRERRRKAPEDWRAVACYRLLLFTGARLSEILTLKWSYIDWNRGLVRLPDSKTGPKNLPLSGPALALIEDLPSLQDNPYVLHGDREEAHFVGIQKPWQRIRHFANLDDVRLHDLRHAFASIAVSGGDSLYLVGKVLGHRQASTTERYAHLQPAPLCDVANRTAAKIAAMLGGTNRPKPPSPASPGSPANENIPRNEDPAPTSVAIIYGDGFPTITR